MHPNTDISLLRAQCAEAETWEELAAIMVREINKFNWCYFLSGPVSTGGYGCPDKNLHATARVMSLLVAQGFGPFFSYQAYEERIRVLKQRWHTEAPSRQGEYCMPILEILYARVISSGKIKAAFVMPGHEGSVGTTWEVKEFRSRQTPLVFLLRRWVDTILAS